MNNAAKLHEVKSIPLPPIRCRNVISVSFNPPSVSTSDAIQEIQANSFGKSESSVASKDNNRSSTQINSIPDGIFSHPFAAFPALHPSISKESLLTYLPEDLSNNPGGEIGDASAPEHSRADLSVATSSWSRSRSNSEDDQSSTYSSHTGSTISTGGGSGGGIRRRVRPPGRKQLRDIAKLMTSKCSGSRHLRGSRGDGGVEIGGYNDASSEIGYAVNMAWMEAWLRYTHHHAYQQPSAVTDGATDAEAEDRDSECTEFPREIDNSTLIAQRKISHNLNSSIGNPAALQSSEMKKATSNVLDTDAYPFVNYFIVCEAVWHAFISWYGGGPTVRVMFHQRTAKALTNHRYLYTVQASTSIVRWDVLFSDLLAIWNMGNVDTSLREQRARELQAGICPASSSTSVTVDACANASTDAKAAETYSVRSAGLSIGEIFHSHSLAPHPTVLAASVSPSPPVLPKSESKAQPLPAQRCVVCDRAALLRCKQCAAVTYCQKDCQLAHWKYHKPVCKQLADAVRALEDQQKQQYQLSSASMLSRLPPALLGRCGKAGLLNLGNSCYMNASLQCLSHIKPLTRHFISGRYKKDLNTGNRDGTGGALAATFSALLRDLWLEQAGKPGVSVAPMTGIMSKIGGAFGAGGGKGFNVSKYSVVSPKAMKSALGRVNEEYAGLQQQDAHEVVELLLDKLHEDLNLVQRKPYVPNIDAEDTAQLASKLLTFVFQHQSLNDSAAGDSVCGSNRSESLAERALREIESALATYTAGAGADDGDSTKTATKRDQKVESGTTEHSEAERLVRDVAKSSEDLALFSELAKRLRSAAQSRGSLLQLGDGSGDPESTTHARHTKPLLRKHRFDLLYRLLQLDELLAQETWRRLRLREDSTVRDLVGTLTRSELTCPDCGRVNASFEFHHTHQLAIPRPKQPTAQKPEEEEEEADLHVLVEVEVVFVPEITPEDLQAYKHAVAAVTFPAAAATVDAEMSDTTERDRLKQLRLNLLRDACMLPFRIVVKVPRGSRVGAVKHALLGISPKPSAVSEGNSDGLKARSSESNSSGISGSNSGGGPLIPEQFLQRSEGKIWLVQGREAPKVAGDIEVEGDLDAEEDEEDVTGVREQRRQRARALSVSSCTDDSGRRGGQQQGKEGSSTRAGAGAEMEMGLRNGYVVSRFLKDSMLLREVVPRMVALPQLRKTEQEKEQDLDEDEPDREREREGMQSGRKEVIFAYCPVAGCDSYTFLYQRSVIVDRERPVPHMEGKSGYSCGGGSGRGKDFVDDESVTSGLAIEGNSVINEVGVGTVDVRVVGVPMMLSYQQSWSCARVRYCAWLNSIRYLLWQQSSAAALYPSASAPATPPSPSSLAVDIAVSAISAPPSEKKSKAARKRANQKLNKLNILNSTRGEGEEDAKKPETGGGSSTDKIPGNCDDITENPEQEMNRREAEKSDRMGEIQRGERQRVSGEVVAALMHGSMVEQFALSRALSLRRTNKLGAPLSSSTAADSSSSIEREQTDPAHRSEKTKLDWFLGENLPADRNLSFAKLVDSAGGDSSAVQFLSTDLSSYLLDVASHQISKTTRSCLPGRERVRSKNPRLGATAAGAAAQEQKRRIFAEKQRNSRFPTLEQCLFEHTKPEVLDCGNEWYCSVCKDFKRAKKIVKFWAPRLPDVLILSLKRFEFRDLRNNSLGGGVSSGVGGVASMSGMSALGGMGFGRAAGSREKIQTYVDFPINGLDLAPYCYQQEPSATAGVDRREQTRGDRGFREENKDSSHRNSDLDDCCSGGCDCRRGSSSTIYDLFAVCNHYGRMGYGHYTASARDCFAPHSVSSSSPSSSTTATTTITNRDSGSGSRDAQVIQGGRNSSGAAKDGRRQDRRMRVNRTYGPWYTFDDDQVYRHERPSTHPTSSSAEGGTNAQQGESGSGSGADSDSDSDSETERDGRELGVKSKAAYILFYKKRHCE